MEVFESSKCFATKVETYKRSSSFHQKHMLQHHLRIIFVILVSPILKGTQLPPFFSMKSSSKTNHGVTSAASSEGKRWAEPPRFGSQFERKICRKNLASLPSQMKRFVIKNFMRCLKPSTRESALAKSYGLITSFNKSTWYLGFFRLGKRVVLLQDNS